MDLNDFGSLQLRVLEMLWDRGEASAGDLWEAWPERARPAYTTVLSALQKLHRRKVARRRKRGRAHVYAACIDRESFRRFYVEEVRRRVFGGEAVGLVAALFDSESISEEEMAEIRRLLKRKEKEDSR